MTGSLITEGFGVWGGVDELILEGFVLPTPVAQTPCVLVFVVPVPVVTTVPLTQTPCVLVFAIPAPVVTTVPRAAWHVTLNGQDARRHVMDGPCLQPVVLNGQDARRYVLSKEN